MESPTRATKGFAWNHLYKVSEYGLFNLYSILVVRHFGPELAGPFTVYLSIFSTLSILSAFAVDGVLLRYAGLVSADADLDLPGYRKGSLRSFLLPLLELRLGVSLALAAIILLVLIGLPLMSSDVGNAFGSISSLAIPLAVSVVLQGVIAFCTSALIGLLETKRILIGSLIARGTLLLVSLLLLSLGSLTILSAVIVHTASLLLGAIVLGGVLLKLSRTPERTNDRFNWLADRKTIAAFFGSGVVAYGIATWGTDLLSMILSRQPDILMMGALFGENSVEITYYHAASIVLLLSEYLFLFGFGGALVSIFSGLSHADSEDPAFAQRGYARLLEARKKVANFQSAATMPFLTFVGIFAGPIIEALFGAAFLPATTLVQVGIVIVAMTVSLLGGGMSITSLVAIGEQKTVFRIRLVFGLINLPLNLLLISSYGALGAVIGTQLCNTGACAAEAFIATRKIGHAIDYTGVLSVYGISIAASLLAYLVCQALGAFNWQAIPLVIFTGTITALAVIVSYHIFHVRIAQDTLHRVYQLFHSGRSRMMTERLSS
ncbi:MAG TPA: polysaccharide biosynthesis C-terminal domain-containing protein [Candidatus Kapabacteria bacterium]|nr:polysaccharide biosynthesis C-terminal domain-containing protein [Candidatus Kapabacteria bacterium]